MGRKKKRKLKYLSEFRDIHVDNHHARYEHAKKIFQQKKDILEDSCLIINEIS